MKNAEVTNYYIGKGDGDTQWQWEVRILKEGKMGTLWKFKIMKEVLQSPKK